MKATPLLAIMLVVSACGQSNAPLSKTTGIFGSDDRIPKPSDSYPYYLVGKVTASGGDCSGTIVHKDLVLTASHCVYRDGALQNNIRFMFNLTNGRSNADLRVTHVWSGTRYNNAADGQAQNWPKDWAILRINRPIGEQVGWMGIKSLDADTLGGTTVTSIGYSGDFAEGSTAGLHAGCSIKEASHTGYFSHDCDTWTGASGGPIIDSDNYIVGISTRGHNEKNMVYDGSNGNIGVNASIFLNQLHYVINSNSMD